MQDQETSQAIAAFWQKTQQAQQEGDEQAARAWLEGIIELDARNVDAWLALARLPISARERLECYANVLQISPGHPEAKEGLRQARRQR